jgi:hypothetical protein
MLKGSKPAESSPKQTESASDALGATSPRNPQAPALACVKSRLLQAFAIMRRRHPRTTASKTYPNVYGRMEWDQPSPTSITRFFGFDNGRFGILRTEHSA